MKKGIVGLFLIFSIVHCCYGNEKIEKDAKEKIVMTEERTSSVKDKELRFKLGAHNSLILAEFVVPIPKRFSVTCNISQKDVFGREFIPEGERFESWTEIITVQERKGLRSNCLKQFIVNLKLGMSRKQLEHVFSFQEEKHIPTGIYITEVPATTIKHDNLGKMKEEKIAGVNEIIGTKAVEGANSIASVQYTIRYNIKTTSTKEKQALIMKMRTYFNECHIEEQCMQNTNSKSGVFRYKEEKTYSLQGKILDNRYYAPKNVFSCQADDYGIGKYISQDVLTDQYAIVGFYSREGHFKKAEVVFLPGLEATEKLLKKIFDDFAIDILEKVDHAEGIEILQHEMQKDNLLFTAISIPKMSVLTDSYGNSLSSTRSYLTFIERDMVVLLSNQYVTPFNEKHDPQIHIKNLKQDILDFRKTFEFGATPLAKT